MSRSLANSLAAIARREVARFDYNALYPAEVQAQRGDGSLDLRLLGDAMVAPPSVPIRIGIPGVSVKVIPGARVLLGFEAGDPSRPYAALWGEDSLKELTIKASVKVTIEAPSVDVSATTATVDAQSVTIAGGLQGVARVGDSVQAGPFAGVITSGSLKVKCG